jgi:beta-N-acetylhexosaminidase
MDNINASVRRILTLKDRHGLLKAYDSGDLEAKIAAATAAVGSKAHHDEEFKMAKQSVTLTKNDGDLLPLREKKQKVLILTAYANELLSADYGKSLAEDSGLVPEGTEITVGCYGTTPAETLAGQIGRSDVVVAISEVTKVAALDPNKAQGAMGAKIDEMILSAHRSGAKFVVLSAHLPYDCVRFPDADAVMLCWSDKGMTEDPRELERDVPQYGPCIPAAIYMMFAKGERVTGRLPVNVPALTEEYTFSDEVALNRGFGLDYKHFCPLCGEVHDDGLTDRLQGVLHEAVYVLQKAFGFLKDNGAALWNRFFS